MVERRKFSVRTNAIAWLQTILFFLAFGGCAFALGYLEMKVSSEKRSDLRVWRIVPTMSLVYTGLGFLMGSILLQGALKRDPGLLGAWLFYSIFCMLVEATAAIVLCFNLTGFEWISGVICCALILLSSRSLFMWVVRNHRDDIIQAKRKARYSDGI